MKGREVWIWKFYAVDTFQAQSYISQVGRGKQRGHLKQAACRFMTISRSKSFRSFEALVLDARFVRSSPAIFRGQKSSRNVVPGREITSTVNSHFRISSLRLRLADTSVYSLSSVAKSQTGSWVDVSLLIQVFLRPDLVALVGRLAMSQPSVISRHFKSSIQRSGYLSRLVFDGKHLPTNALQPWLADCDTQLRNLEAACERSASCKLEQVYKS